MQFNLRLGGQLIAVDKGSVGRPHILIQESSGLARDASVTSGNIGAGIDFRQIDFGEDTVGRRIAAQKNEQTAKRTETAPEYARPAEYSKIAGISDNNQITPAKNTTKKRTAERILKKRFIKQKN